MKKIILIILLLVSLSVHSKWIVYGQSRGSLFWYNSDQIKIEGNYIYVWNRSRYGKIIEGNKGSKQHHRINCSEFSYEILEIKYYKDVNWTILSKSITMVSKKETIRQDSVTATLAKKICGKVKYRN